MKLGVYIDSIDDQMSESVEWLNKLSAEYDLVCFTANVPKKINVLKFPVLFDANLFTFYGHVLITKQALTKVLFKVPTVKSILYYDVSLEWTRKRPLDLQEQHNIYYNDRVSLIANSESDFYFLHKCWRKPIGIIRDFSYEDTIQLITNNKLS